MADKRVTTVDEMRNPDENADFVLIVRGTQRDLRRLRLNLLPADFDLHDDVDTELTSLAGIDRLLISDEGSPGAPQKFVKLSTLQSYFTNPFDLHDDVPTELTEAAEADRLLIADEDQAGDPQKWISVKNLLGLPRSWSDPTLRNFKAVYTGISHGLGRTPTRFKIDLQCKNNEANTGWSAGDKIIDFAKAVTNPGNSSVMTAFALFDVSSTTFSIAASNGYTSFFVPHKTNGSVHQATLTNWQFLVTLY